MTVLAESIVTAVIAAPFERIDLSSWIFSLRDDEYQACSKAHIACGSGRAPDGRRMSINVERISGNLLVQHYVEQLAEPDHVVLESLTDSYSELGDAKLVITWELSLARGATGAALTNHVIVRSTESYLRALAAAGIHGLDAVKARMAENLDAHNREETPLFALNIQSKAGVT